HAAAAEIGPQLADQRAHPVLPGGAAALLHPQPPGREVDLVVEDDHLGGLHLVEARSLGHGPAALVHIGLRPHQHDLHAAARRLALARADDRLELAALWSERPPAGDLVGGYDADVVAIALVLRSRVAEARDDV